MSEKIHLVLTGEIGGRYATGERSDDVPQGDSG